MKSSADRKRVALFCGLLLAGSAAQAGLFSSAEEEAAKAEAKQHAELTDRKIQALQGAVNDLLQEKEGLRGEIRQLRGELDQQGQAVESLKRQLKDTYLELDQRIKAAGQAGSTAPASEMVGDGGTASPAGSLPPVGGAGSSGGAVAPSLAASLPHSSAPETPPQAAAVAPSGMAATDTATAGNERDAYQAAYRTLMEQNYPQAANELRTFLTRYPSGQYAANAQYWLGEAYYAARNGDAALAEFNKVLTDFPKSSKVPDAMLKIGYLQAERQQTAQARQILESLVREYPDSTASRLASKKLESLP